MRQLLSRLRKNETGAAVVEFALLAPMFMVMFFGILQVGLGMQSYNAMRNVSADVARYSMVQYQTGNKLSTSQIRTWARNHAQGAPYLLDGDRLGVTITEEGTSRVDGAKEFTIEVRYKITSIIPYVDDYAPTLDFERPVFLLDA